MDDPAALGQYVDQLVDRTGFDRQLDLTDRTARTVVDPQVLDGRTHTLEVRVSRPQMRARARNSYLAVSEE